MSNTYKIDYTQIRQRPQISTMLDALERGLANFEIDFYLVGAVARDVWMNAINQTEPRRATKDIDFAVFIKNTESYTQLKDYLIQNEGFAPYRGNDFVLIWNNSLQVDLLPFGEIEDVDGRVTTNGVGLASISMPGFREIYETGLPELTLDNTHTFKFCTLPGIVLLKLIAFDDRPEARRDDIKDISDILKHFFDMYAEEIYENHNELFEDANDNLMHIAAQVLGREIKKITYRNPTLNQRVDNILMNNTNTLENSRIGQIMVEYFNNTVEENVLLLRYLLKGFTE
ncbi:hypothetical protein [Emticicia agri]|uniref:Nucleotidyltransferase n=1 Tax=Emticicia agri TaxID=2492393 RepID=A0A4Q5LSY5_9BACT|nr:hypothetical protein [Emticicia agri]RYU92718.1 hypothetical protein EWM59_25770 [Emticicia agri]